MVQTQITLTEEQNRVVNMVKAANGLKNKAEAVALIVGEYAESIMEPELRPEFIAKIRKIEKEGKFIHYGNIEELKADIENA